MLNVVLTDTFDGYEHCYMCIYLYTFVFAQICMHANMHIYIYIIRIYI